MQVFFINQSTGKALSRTSRILDSYAQRIGSRAWKTPITQEALREIYSLLKRKASRTTCIACYQARRHGEALLWVIGSKVKFNQYGFYAVGVTEMQPIKNQIPVWFSQTVLVLKAAALSHDFGKDNVFFQQKIRGLTKTIRDPYRHEWLSCLLNQIMRENTSLSWKQAWEVLAKSKVIKTDPALDTDTESYWCGLRLMSWSNCIDSLVLTHHGLGKEGRFRNFEMVLSDQKLCLQPNSEGPARSLKLWLATEARISSELKSNADPQFWKAVHLFYRPALIAADHVISQELVFPVSPIAHSSSFANSFSNFSHFKDKTHEWTLGLNQPLDDHLWHVANRAADYAYKFLSLEEELPCLSLQSIEKFEKGGGVERFEWQTTGANFLASCYQKNSLPGLVFNMAGTGAGKTRANIRFACALRERVRIAVALNLRTLTVQTAAAYEQMGIASHELGLVVGDTTAKVFNEKVILDRPDLQEDQDGNDMMMPDYDVWGEETDIPQYLEAFFQSRTKSKTILSAPLLVSTLDYLIQAGQPGDQGHYVRALLRVMTSDIVIDEIDSIDSLGIVSILRLIQIAAFYGRNIVCSSATLPEPILLAVYNAYKSGIDLRSLLRKEERQFNVFFVDNILKPENLVITEQIEEKVVHQWMQNRLGSLHQTLQSDRNQFRVADFIRFTPDDSTAWMKSVESAIFALHHNHGNKVQGLKVSVGLIRVANIKHVQLLARFLAKSELPLRVACYHSQDLTISRLLKEKHLDHLLTRHNGDEAIARSQWVQLALKEGRQDLILVVVATPVEEVGRDHDFDWGVVDVSSMTSVVQCAGRINRHRLRQVDREKPNIMIPQYNFRYCLLQEKNKKGKMDYIYYLHPGHQIDKADSSANSYKGDVSQMILLNPEYQNILVNAGLRFSEKNLLTALDNYGIKSKLGRYFDHQGVFLSPVGFLIDDYYKKTPLRANDQIDIEGELRQKEGTVFFVRFEQKSATEYKTHSLHTKFYDHSSDKTWLTWSAEEMLTLAEELEIRHLLKFRISLYENIKEWVDPEHYSNWTGFTV